MTIISGTTLPCVVVVAGIEDRNNVYRCGISHKVFRRPMTYGDNDILTRVSCFVKGFCFDVSLLTCTPMYIERNQNF